MKVALVVNTRSGRGVGQHVGAVLEDRIITAGHVCVRLDVSRDLEDLLPGALREADALVIAGGDGTVHHAASAAIEAEVPIYHAPLGTENLVARQFAMRRDAEHALAAIDAHRVLPIDAGVANGRVFLVMCSVGADASIIQRLHAERKGAITRLSYAPHIVAEALRPSLPSLRIVADGREVVSGERGLLIVANSRQYAARLDPAHDASMTDGKLDLLFLPATMTATLVLWALRCWVRTAGSHPKSVSVRASEIDVSWEGPAPPAQIDGEAFELTGKCLEMRVLPRALPMLLPPDLRIATDADTVGAAAAGGTEVGHADKTQLPADDRGDGGDRSGAGGGRDAEPASHR